MANPERWLVVKTTYFTPASFASTAQSWGWNLRGLKVLGSSVKKRVVKSLEAPTSEWLITTPSWLSRLQWMNNPKPWSRNHSRRSGLLREVVSPAVWPASVAARSTEPIHRCFGVIIPLLYKGPWVEGQAPCGIPILSLGVLGGTRREVFTAANLVRPRSEEHTSEL